MSTVDYAEREKGDNFTQMLGINTDVYMWVTTVGYSKNSNLRCVVH